MIRRNPKGRLTTDGWGLRFPLLGRINRKNKVARIGRTLGTLVNSGVPLLQGLEITRDTVGNKVIESAIAESRAMTTVMAMG